MSVFPNQSIDIAICVFRLTGFPGERCGLLILTTYCSVFPISILAHGGCDRWTGDAYSSSAPDPISGISRGGIVFAMHSILYRVFWGDYKFVIFAFSCSHNYNLTLIKLHRFVCLLEETSESLHIFQVEIWKYQLMFLFVLPLFI